MRRFWRAIARRLRSSAASGRGLLDAGFLWQGDRDLVEADGVVKDQLVERRLPECCLRGDMPHSLGIRPWAVETREVAGPQEIAQAYLGHPPKPALFLDLEREENLALDEFARLVGEHDIGFEDAGGRSAKIVFAVEAPEQEWHPPDTCLF